jgi:hypothetical protein
MRRTYSDDLTTVGADGRLEARPMSLPDVDEIADSQ